MQAGCVTRIETILEKTDMAPYSIEQYGTVYEKTACIMEGLCRGHAFRDGDKRTLLCAAAVFLRANGIRLGIPPDVTEFVRMMASSTDTTKSSVNSLIKTIAAWLERGARFDAGQI